MAYFVRYKTGQLPDGHPEEGFDNLPDALMFARGVKESTNVRREDV